MRVKYPELQDANWLHRKYIVEKMNTGQITALVGCSNGGVVAKSLHRAGIPVRSTSESCRGRVPPNKGVAMSVEQRALLSAVKRGVSHSTPESRAAQSRAMCLYRSGTTTPKPRQGRHQARKLFKIQGLCAQCGAKAATDRHHKDENTFNNTAENIELVCRSCHMRFHSFDRHNKRRTKI